MALSWVLQDETRAQRLLSLTGLTPENLRISVGDPAVQASILEFLANHEADLLAAADALGLEPQILVDAHRDLSGNKD